MNSFFDTDADNWESIYSAHDVFSVIHQQRQLTALAWLDAVNLAAGTTVLEVGCGVGRATIEMARRGLVVTACDSSAEMVRKADANLRRAGIEHGVSLSQADIHDPPFEPESFGLVIALGVIPWLHSPETALSAITRMLRPGGYLIANVDNARRLEVLLDPRFSPWLSSARELLRGRRRPEPANEPAVADTTRHLRSEFDSMLVARGLTKVRATTLGFGPFTFLGRQIFPDGLAVGLHSRLQQMADLGVPGLRASGAQYLVLARRAADQRA